VIFPSHTTISRATGHSGRSDFTWAETALIGQVTDAKARIEASFAVLLRASVSWACRFLCRTLEPQEAMYCLSFSPYWRF
jgi:hypothetical protein